MSFKPIVFKLELSWVYILSSLNCNTTSVKTQANLEHNTTYV